MPDENTTLSLEELLSRLEVREDLEPVQLTLHGRALSRSDNNLYLGVPAGIVSIPIDAIENVDPISCGHPDAVSVLVREAGAVRPLGQVKPGTTVVFHKPDPPAGENIGEFIGHSLAGVGTLHCWDTTTGEGDATTSDDEKCTSSADDIYG